MNDVPGGVVKIVELVGSSPDSFSAAVRNAVKTASQTLRNIRGVDVIGSTAECDEQGNLSVYKVHCKIAFVLDQADGSQNGQRAKAQAGAGATRPPSDS